MPKTLTGKVTSDKGDKTIVITVTERKTHPLYKKQYSVNTKFMAHDQDNKAKLGDTVIIVETRPISARKRFNLQEVVEKVHAHFEEADAVADVPQEEVAKKEAVAKPAEAKQPKAQTKATKEKA